MAKVVIDNVDKYYGDNQVVFGINLEVKDGEFLVLVGPSGCGKSTTLRMIAGLEDISKGSIWIGNKDVTGEAPKDRDIAMVFQNYALYPHKNVYENLAFALKLQKKQKKEIEERVNEVANILGLQEYLDRKPKQLSGGQRQRVALGRAIVRKPSVFLMDEPLSNLDAKLRVSMRAEISKLHKCLKTTTVYVTHDQTEAMTLGDRVVVMKDGRIQQVGTPLEIYENPANMMVAGFIGSPGMNFVICRVVEQDNCLFIQNNELKVPVPVAVAERLKPYENQKIAVGIRPEHCYLSDGSGALETEIQVVETIGGDSFLHTEKGDTNLIVKCSSKEAVGISEKFNIDIDVEQMKFFDCATGKKI
ncbi:sn-glycerol-3-phosphate ABC transporter ATP-binding protein UgpC [Clostridia bacterium]|nr:sn-glycerol-3-phosphate ABC transporter ATP-binding protein UgpC [Clostridia bacterium]